MNGQATRKENLRCIIYMIIAMAGFAIEDAIIKQLSLSMPISEVLVLIGSGGLFAFSLMAKTKSVPLLTPNLKKPWFVVRTLSELVAAICFVSAIVFASLSTSSAIIQATPLAVVLGGALFLKQSVSKGRWILILAGFLGVLLVVQPGLNSFNPSALLALVAVFFLALRDTITRALSVSIPAITISFWAFFASFLAGVITIPFFGPLQPLNFDQLILVFGATLAGSGAYLAVVLATREGDIAVVAPFRYSRLVFALGISVLIFKEPVNTAMLVGSAMIVGSGIMMLILRDRPMNLTVKNQS